MITMPFYTETKNKRKMIGYIWNKGKKGCTFDSMENLRHLNVRNGRVGIQPRGGKVFIGIC